MRSRPTSIQIIRSSDLSIHESMKKIASDLDFVCTSLKCSSTIASQHPNGNHPIEVAFEINKPFEEGQPQTSGLVLFKHHIDLNGAYIKGFHYKFDTLEIQVTRSFDLGTGRFTGLVDTVYIPEIQIEELDLLHLIKAIRSSFKPSDDTQLPAFIADDLKKYYQVREASLSKLEDKFTELVTKLADYRILTEGELLAKKQTMEKLDLERIANLETERVKMHEEVEAIRVKLDERAAKLNDRENVHERRRLYDSIKVQIANKAKAPELTVHTSNLRRTIWIISGALVVFLTTVFGICFYKNVGNRSPLLN